MLVAVYVILLIAAFFWLGLSLGKGYRPARPSLEMALPRDAHLFRAAGPPRRTERVNLSIPILVTGLDAAGEKINESTHTVTISGYGASVIVNRELKLGEEVTLHRADRSRQAIVRVLHKLSKTSEGSMYGVAFVDPSADLWGACKLLTEALAQNSAEASTPATETKMAGKA